MYIFGIGNVTECNKHWIHLNDGGRQERVAANAERLDEIRKQAIEDEQFYDRMWNEIHAEYERRMAAVKEKYKVITEDDIKAAYERSRDEGWRLSITKDSNNEQCLRQVSYVHGFFEAATLAMERKDEARRLKTQATSALKEVK